MLRFRLLLVAGAALLWFSIGASLSAAAPTFTGWSAPVSLGPVVNSPAFEGGPAISADGLSLYFYVPNRPGGFGDNDIWVSQRSTAGAAWGPPVNLGATINTAAMEYVPAFTPDGHWMYFASDRPLGFGGSDIYKSYRADIHDDLGWTPTNVGGWQTPTNLGGNVNSVADDNAAGYFENGGHPQLFFGSGRLGGAARDLFLSTLQADGTWGVPTLLTELSSASTENRPSVRFDGLEIFFYSNRPGSAGNDLWSATRATVDAPWSSPVNVASLNSSAADQHPYLSADGQTLVFNSNRGAAAAGNLDLYMATRDAIPAVTGATVAATEGVLFNGVVATVADPGAAATAGEYTALVDWGDGSLASLGTVGGADGAFTISGSHTYAEEGIYTVTSTLTDVDTPENTPTASTSIATVADAALTASVMTLSSVEGSTLSGVVAKVSDADPLGSSAELTASIDWGDGSSSIGTLTVNGAGFDVSGSHVYVDEGAYPVKVTVLDEGGSTVVAAGTASVADAPLAAGLIQASCGARPCGATFGFRDANPGATVSDFVATINWGDGTSSAAVVTASGVGFAAAGSHTYTDGGSGHAITVTVTDDGGKTLSASAPTVLVSLLVGLKSHDDDAENGSRFRVAFSCPSGTATALLNGVAVTNGQIVRLKLKGSGVQKVKVDDGRLTITAASFLLVVSCTDAAGNKGCATATPVFEKRTHDDRQKDAEKDQNEGD